MRRVVVAASIILSAGACGRESSVPAISEGADTVHMAVAWEVAPAVHPIADSLGQVSGVAVDGSGNVYISDRMAAKVWVLDSEGRFKTAVGGKGEGPGEFEAPTGPAVGPDGRLYVRDVYRVSVFGADSANGLLTRIEETLDGPVYPDWMSTRATRFDTTGAVLYPGKQWRDDGTARPYVIRLTTSGVLTDTIFVPEYSTAPQLTALIRTGPRGGRLLPGLNHVPFAPLPVWDVTTAGTMVSGDGRSYDLVEMDREGRVLARYSRAVPPDEVPAEEHRDSVAALRSRLDSVPVEFDRVEGMPEEVRSLRVPERFPPYRAVYVDVDGDIWVRRWLVGGNDQSVFDVFGRGGEFKSTVVLPRAIHVEPTPFLSDSAVVGVTTHALTDESIVISFKRN